MRKSLALATLFGLSFVFVGCGGGSGIGGSTPIGSTPTGNSQTTTVGNASITYQGKLRAAVTATSEDITAVGVAGASISSLTYYPTNNIANTNILYQVGDDLYSYSEQTGVSTNLTHGLSISYYESSSTNGFIAFTRQNSAGTFDIWYMRSDGSAQTKVTTGINFISASMAFNANYIAAIDASGNLYRVNTVGGALTKLFSPSGGITPDGSFGISWSPDGSRIAFNGTSGQFYTIPNSGGTPTQILSGMTFEFPAWSPDSSLIVGDNGGTIYIISSTGSATQTPLRVIGSSSLYDSGACFSPDGKRIVYQQTGSGSGVQHGVFTCDPSGTNETLLFPFGSTTISPVVWTPFYTSENMIGSGGTVSPAGAAGFVVSNGLRGFGSLLSFSATTPSSAVVTSSTAQLGPLAFTISADSLTLVSWINSYNGLATSKALTSTPQLVFGMDSSTGAISFVAPALVAKESGVSRITTGSFTTYLGKFSSVFDGQGKNLAPAGASSIKVDAKTNRVLSAR